MNLTYMVFLDIWYSFGGPEPFHISGLHCIPEMKDFLKYVTVTYIYRSLNNPNLDELLHQRNNRNMRHPNQFQTIFPNCDSVVLTCLTLYIYVLDSVKVKTPSSTGEMVPSWC